MASNSIDLKVMACKDLKSCNFFQKCSVYVSVAIGDGDDKKKRKQEQKTGIDKEGGANPEWNHQMQFSLDEDISSSPDRDRFFLEFDLHNDGIFGDKILGEVRVPIADLMEESNGAVRFVSYQIRTAEGKPNGILNFSYKVNLKRNMGMNLAKEDGNRGVLAVYSAPAVYPPQEKKPSLYPTIDDTELEPQEVPIISYYPPPPLGTFFQPGPPPPLSSYGFRPEPYGYPLYSYPAMEQAMPYNNGTRGFGWGNGASRII